MKGHARGHAASAESSQDFNATEAPRKMLDTSVLGLLRLTGKVQKALPMLGPALQAEKDGSPRDTLVCPSSKREGRQAGGRSSEVLALNQFLAPTPYSIRTSTKILTQGLADFFHTRPDSEDVSTREPCGLSK